MSVAVEIREQIRALDRLALLAWGAKEFLDMGDGLKFKTSGLTKWKGYVYVKYDVGADLYNVDFFKIRNADIKYTERLVGVFVGDLVRVIDKVVR